MTKPDVESRPQIEKSSKAVYDPENIVSKEYFDQWFKKLSRRLDSDQRNLDTIAKAIQDEDEISSAYKKAIKS